MFLKSLMPAPGLITRNRPLDERETADVEFGFPIAKVVAGQDIGQTIVVKEMAVVAVEGLEGTDECIRRAGLVAGPGASLSRSANLSRTFVSTSPSWGGERWNRCARPVARRWQLSARESLFFDREEVVRGAEESGIAIVAR